MLFYVLSTSHVQHILEANQTRVISHSAVFLDDEFRRVVLWNNEFIRKINQVSFPGDVGYFATSLNLNIGYSYIKLTKNTTKFNVIILLWEE